eukprot:scaffold59115_cov20-Tisochrysis_lutea.AAC.1
MAEIALASPVAPLRAQYTQCPLMQPSKHGIKYQLTVKFWMHNGVLVPKGMKPGDVIHLCRQCSPSPKGLLLVRVQQAQQFSIRNKRQRSYNSPSHDCAPSHESA